MQINVQRNSGFIDTASKFQPVVNGEKKNKIKNNETIILDISEENSTLKISQMGVSSNEISVNDGDNILLTNTNFGTYGRVIMLVSILLVIFLPNIILQGVALIIAIVLFVLTFFGSTPNYHLEKVDTIE